MLARQPLQTHAGAQGGVLGEPHVHLVAQQPRQIGGRGPAQLQLVDDVDAVKRTVGAARVVLGGDHHLVEREDFRQQPDHGFVTGEQGVAEGLVTYITHLENRGPDQIVPDHPVVVAQVVFCSFRPRFGGFNMGKGNGSPCARVNHPHRRRLRCHHQRQQHHCRNQYPESRHYLTITLRDNVPVSLVMRRI